MFCPTTMLSMKDVANIEIDIFPNLLARMFEVAWGGGFHSTSFHTSIDEA